MICPKDIIYDKLFTFGKILEKHSSSSSDKPIWGRKSSVIIFKIPAEMLNFKTIYIWIKGIIKPQSKQM